jgi:hypothetical protein
MVDLGKVMEFLAVKESQARVLLMHHRRNVERIFDARDRKVMERLFTESGLPFVKNEAVGFHLFELIIINYNMYELICNKYILYNSLSNYIRYEVIKLYIINRV